MRKSAGAQLRVARLLTDALRLQVGTPVGALLRVGRLLTDALRLQVGTPVGGSALGGKTYDGCVATSNWNASLCFAQVARLVKDAL